MTPANYYNPTGADAVQNDIAITQDSDSGEWIVLETVPGIKFRAFLKQNNRFTALQYFRTLANDANDASKESLQTAIGLNFQPRFENLLKLISCEQIVHVDPSPMRGAHGAVYRATWARPASIGVADAEIREVALKTVRAADGLDPNRVFREVSTRNVRDMQLTEALDSLILPLVRQWVRILATSTSGESSKRRWPRIGWCSPYRMHCLRVSRSSCSTLLNMVPYCLTSRSR